MYFSACKFHMDHFGVVSKSKMLLDGNFKMFIFPVVTML